MSSPAEDAVPVPTDVNAEESDPGGVSGAATTLDESAYLTASNLGLEPDNAAALVNDAEVSVVNDGAGAATSSSPQAGAAATVPPFAGRVTIPTEVIEKLNSGDPTLEVEATTALKSYVVRIAADDSFDLLPRAVVTKLVQILGHLNTEPADVGGATTAGAVPAGSGGSPEVKLRHQAQMNAAWILTKLTATSSAVLTQLISDGIVPVLVRHVANETYEDLRVQSVWILGNIAGDGPSRRDHVLQSGVLAPLLHLISQETRFKRAENVTHVLNLQAVRLSVWCLSNLCRGRPEPPPNFASLLPSLPVLARMLQAQDKEILRDTCFAFASLSDGTHEKIQSVINSGVVGRLVQLLQHPSKMVVASALRAVGNVLLGDDFQTQKVIDNEGLPALLQLLLSDDEHVRKDACRAISNITAGSSEQIQAVLNAGVFPVLIELMQTPCTKGVDLEAGWAVLNVAKRGTQAQLDALAEMGCDPRLFQLSATASGTGSRRPNSSSSSSDAAGRNVHVTQRFGPFRSNYSTHPHPPSVVSSDSSIDTDNALIDAIITLGNAAAASSPQRRNNPTYAVPGYSVALPGAVAGAAAGSAADTDEDMDTSSAPSALDDLYDDDDDEDDDNDTVGLDPDDLD